MQCKEMFRAVLLCSERERPRRPQRVRPCHGALGLKFQALLSAGLFPRALVFCLTFCCTAVLESFGVMSRVPFLLPARELCPHPVHLGLGTAPRCLLSGWGAQQVVSGQCCGCSRGAAAVSLPP